MNKYSNVRLFYFSGTGNTYLIAKTIEDEFNKNGYKTTLEKMQLNQDLTFAQNELIGLIFPVAIQSTFPNVWEFAKHLPRANGQDAFMVDTMGGFSGGVVGPMKELLTSKGYNCIGAKEIKMANSMQTSLRKFKEGKSKNLLALDTAKRYVGTILDGSSRWRRVPILSGIMRSISANRKIWTQLSRKIEVSEDKCIKCGQCIKYCPEQALKSEDGKIIIDHTKCISCFRCINYCPQNAFLFDKKTLYQKKNAKLKDFA